MISSLQGKKQSHGSLQKRALSSGVNRSSIIGHVLEPPDPSRAAVPCCRVHREELAAAIGTWELTILDCVHSYVYRSIMHTHDHDEKIDVMHMFK
jgi:hypothetical protein